MPGSKQSQVPFATDTDSSRSDNYTMKYHFRSLKNVKKKKKKKSKIILFQTGLSASFH